MRSVFFAAIVVVLALLTAGPAAVTAAPASAETAPAPPGLLAPLSDGAAPLLPLGGELDAGLPSPQGFLGYPLGARFTHHDRVLGYLTALAEASDRVALWSYGSTYEGRPLTLAAVSSAENIARLEEIRRDHLRLADPTRLAGKERERLLDELPVVVWLGYGVHGNESSSTEAALATVYLLAAAEGESAARLDGMVVLIDPLSNPDGRERYVHAYEQRRGREADPDPGALEHQEPWPGGRQNHYLIDLNRDWAWATQQETRRRLTAYREWEPQVHVDLHEMSSRSSYFFPPAADPILPLIANGNLAWLDVFGRANAEAFDRNGWIYYNAENFDLFYPGYGDSYPFLRGAVGMTYEMAGGGAAGLAIRLPDGRTLTLADRVARHLTASLATAAAAAAHRRELLASFAEARLAGSRGEPVSYLWEASQPEALELASLLALHGIQVHRLSRSADLAVTPAGLAQTAVPARRAFAEGDFAVSTRQPLASLARALLSQRAAMPESFLERQRQRVEQGLDPEFYDITGWALPLAYNLRLWQMEGEPGALQIFLAGSAVGGGMTGSGDLGYLLAPRGLVTYRAAARMERQGIRFRLALVPLEVAGVPYPPGTLFIPRRDNREDLDDVLAALAEETGCELRRVATSYRGEGVSLGSDQVVPVRPLRVGLLLGEGIRPTAAGSLWHLLDQEVELPLDLLALDPADRLDLSGLDVLVLPDGNGYRQAFAEEQVEALGRWLEAGGTLVAVGDAVEWLGEAKLTSFETWKPEQSPQSTPGRGAQDLDRLPLYTPGAVVATEMAPGHPLTLGLPSPPPVLVRGTLILRATKKPQQDILTVAGQTPVLSGFAWPEAEDRLTGSLLVGLETRGAGRVVAFAQEPAFRLFWRGTMPLFLNAVMYGPSLDLDTRY
jgi:hypothetical protein